MIRLGSEELERIAKALADDQRFDILEAIAGAEELSCKALVDRFPVTQATVSHHLKELLTAGLVAVRQDGQLRLYRSRPEVLQEYLAQLDRRLLRARR
jgi:ArsR family transcriptional regulator, arsenate/arsenite/antimonite-responsive transcriptional repressor